MKKFSHKVLGILMLSILMAGTSALYNLEALYAAKAVSLEVQPGKMININTAGNEELQSLNGIGPAMAQRIIEYRQTNGRFEKTEDLTKVRGIGGAKFQKMKGQISI